MIDETDKNIIVSINRKETNRIPIEDVINKNMNLIYIIKKEIDKNPEIRAAEKFYVHINGKNVLPSEVKKILIKNIKTIEIFDKKQ